MPSSRTCGAFCAAEIVDELGGAEENYFDKPEVDETKRFRVEVAEKLVSFAVFPPVGRKLVPVRDLRRLRSGGNKVIHCPILSIYWNGGFDYVAAVTGQDELDVDVFSVFVHSSENSLTGVLEPLKEWLERHPELGDAVWQLVRAMYSGQTAKTNFRDLWEASIYRALDFEFKRGDAEPCLCCSNRFHVLSCAHVDDDHNECGIEMMSMTRLIMTTTMTAT